MKAASFSIAIVFAGSSGPEDKNYKNYAAEKRGARRIICDAKAEQTISAFPIASSLFGIDPGFLQISVFKDQRSYASQYLMH